MDGTLLDRTLAAPWPMLAGHLATVVSVSDPESLGRVQLRLLSYDGVAEHDAPVWARVAVPFAGADRGAFMIPDVGDEVIVIFVNGDPRFPIVVGSLWNGADRPPEQLPGDRVDRWTIVGKAGTRIAIVEDGSARETITFETPGGVSGELTDRNGGTIRLQANTKLELEVAGNTITIDTSSIRIQASSEVSVQAGQVKVEAGLVTVNAGMSRFSGVVQCDTLIASSVVSSSYTPGAGNVW
jgi:uncharacterized protein involved in type VI secretion and phage assembly